MNGHRSTGRGHRGPHPAPRRRRHLIDPDAPPRPRDPAAEVRSLSRVQRWVVSSLAVTTILHLAVAIVIAAVFLQRPTLAAQIGLNLIAGAFGVIAVGAFLAIHRRPILSWWLLAGFLPALVGLHLVLR